VTTLARHRATTARLLLYTTVQCTGLALVESERDYPPKVRIGGDEFVFLLVTDNLTALQVNSVCNLAKDACDKTVKSHWWDRVFNPKAWRKPWLWGTSMVAHLVEVKPGMSAEEIWRLGREGLEAKKDDRKNRGPKRSRATAAKRPSS